MMWTKNLGLLMVLAAGACAANLSVGMVTAVAGHSASSSVTFQNQGAQIAGLQFDLLYDTTSVSISIAAGSAATASGKQASVISVLGGQRVIIVGFNQNLIANGDVADLTITVGASVPSGSYPLTLSNASGTDASGSPVAVGASSGAVVVVPGPPTTLTPSPSSLLFGSYSAGGTVPSAQNITVTSTNPSGGLAFTTSLGSDCAWLALNPTSGATGMASATLIASVIAANVTAGNHTCLISFNAFGVFPSPIVTATLSYTPARFSQLGVFRPPTPVGGALGFFTLDSNGDNAFEVTDRVQQFGLAGDVPVAGDWDGSGVVRVGVFRCPAVGICSWYLDLNNNGVWDGTFGGDTVFQFGLAGDIPVVGDWTGTGVSKVGVMRCPAVGQPGTCTWYLDAGNKRLPSDPTNLIYSYGLPGDQPAVSNWSGVVAGSSPVDQIGVYRNGLWIVDSNGNGQFSPSDATFNFGLAGDIPAVGNWNGTGAKRIGVFRNGVWYLDTNGNGSFDAADQIVSFGLPGDKPLVGFWTVL